MLFKKTYKKSGWSKIEITGGRVSAARTAFILDAERSGQNIKTVFVREAFSTKAEAENWIKWAM